MINNNSVVINNNLVSSKTLNAMNNGFKDNNYSADMFSDVSSRLRPQYSIHRKTWKTHLFLWSLSRILTNSNQRGKQVQGKFQSREENLFIIYFLKGKGWVGDKNTYFLPWFEPSVICRYNTELCKLTRPWWGYFWCLLLSTWWEVRPRNSEGPIILKTFSIGLDWHRVWRQRSTEISHGGQRSSCCSDWGFY